MKKLFLIPALSILALMACDNGPKTHKKVTRIPIQNGALDTAVVTYDKDTTLFVGTLYSEYLYKGQTNVLIPKPLMQQMLETKTAIKNTSDRIPLASCMACSDTQVLDSIKLVVMDVSNSYVSQK